jgi:hypothetical protein
MVCRYDRQVQSYVAGFTAPALDALLQYVATCPLFGRPAERDHYTAELRWRIDHHVRQLPHTPYQPAHAPEVLPNQLSLF